MKKSNILPQYTQNRRHFLYEDHNARIFHCCRRGRFHPAAAQKLYLAQPSLTKSLQSMEQELGVQLFTRTSSGIRLTIAGETILPQARQVIALYNGWLELGTVTSLKKVDVYSHISLAEFLVPDILLRLRESYPELTVSYRTEAQPERYLSADSQEPHLILTLGSPQVDLSRELKALNNRKVVLASGVYGCLVNRLSPLAQRESLTFSDLKKYYLAFPNHTLEPMNQSDSALAAIDQFLPDLVRTITDKHIVEVGTVNSVVELVRQHTDTYAIAFAPTHYRYSGVQTGGAGLCSSAGERSRGRIAVTLPGASLSTASLFPKPCQ